ncbi:MAG: AI-2E family transporter [Candidatus Eiseniibacteriota bacterium]
MAASGFEARELPRSVLLVLFSLGLLAGCPWVLRPFLVAIICATTLAISTWPLLTSLQKKLGGRRWAAIALLLGLMTIAFLVPVYFGALTFIESVGKLSAFVQDLPNRTVPALPNWLVGIPLLGPRIQEGWGELAGAGAGGLKERLANNGDEILRWAMGRLGNLVGMLVQVFVVLGITGLLYARGERVAADLLGFSRRLAGARGEESARLAALATRGVALGVVLTPLIQSILAGIGMAVAGAPQFGLFAILVLVSCLAQAGPIPAMLIPVVLLLARGDTLPAILLGVWAIVVHLSGPIIRPMLIKRGVDLPLPLILAGVIGGVSAFGVVGLFIGPVLLAVAMTLLGSWIAEDPTTTSAS